MLQKAWQCHACYRYHHRFKMHPVSLVRLFLWIYVFGVCAKITAATRIDNAEDNWCKKINSIKTGQLYIREIGWWWSFWWFNCGHNIWKLIKIRLCAINVFTRNAMNTANLETGAFRIVSVTECSGQEVHTGCEKWAILCTKLICLAEKKIV